MRAAVCFVLLTVVYMAHSQRSGYAPRPVGVLQVLNRFKDEEDNLPNRIGGENATRDQGPLELPSGAMGDPYLNPHLPQWPTQHQPFWYLNQQQIMNHRGQTQRGQTTTQQPGGQQASQVDSQQGSQAVGQTSGQQASQQGSQAVRPQVGQPSRQQANQTGRQQVGRQQGGQQVGQPSGQQASQQGSQTGRQQVGQPSRQQGNQVWGRPL